MELQISDLVTSIKKEGIDAANKEAEEIITAAKAQAAAIVEQAKKEAAQIKEKNESEINVLKESALLNAEHAKRDAMLSFRDAVQAEYEKILSTEVARAIDGDTLAQLIKAALNGEDANKYCAEVAAVTEQIKSALAEEIRNGLEIKINRHMRVGFKLAQKDGAGYFDCSDEEIASMLAPFFPELTL